jgi:FOG: Glucan-binding domain (YG repeat)
MINKRRTISVNIKKKLTSLLMMTTIMLSFGQGIVVQAQGATSEATTTSTSVEVTNSLEANSTSGNTAAASGLENTDITKVEPINLIPSPGVPETKPNPLNVIGKYDSQIVNNAQNGSVNITSTIGWKKENGYWYYYKSDNTKASGWIKQMEIGIICTPMVKWQQDG